jgi:hypothetical protein
MIRRAWMALIIMAFFAGVALAADVDGRWEGTVQGPDGDMQIAFNFKADGAKLTGTVETPNGDMPIADGKIDGNHIYFKTSFGDSDIKHDGTVTGDTIQLKVEGPWGQSDMTLKRAKEKKTS